MWRSLVLLSILNQELSARMVMFFYRRPDFKYSAEFANITWDFSLYDNSTRQHPVELVPALTIDVIKDVHRLTVSLILITLSKF
jgi:hypothetical protein